MPLLVVLPAILLPLTTYASFPEGQPRVLLIAASSVVYILGVMGATVFTSLQRRKLSKIRIEQISSEEVTRTREHFAKRWNFWNYSRTVAVFIALLLLILAAVSGFQFKGNSGACVYIDHTVCGYKEVNGLHMYYEIHGQAGDEPPLVLLHGQFATGGMFYHILPELVKSRQVIIIEQQGHGHTADIDRPLRASLMAGDTAKLLSKIGVEQADVFGYSEGGSIALHLAVHHPERIRKLIVASAVYDIDGYLPGMADRLQNLSAHFLPPIIRESYIRVAPDPNGLHELVRKSAEMAKHPENLQPEQLAKIEAPSLVIIGDQDIIRLEHAEKMARLLETDLLIVPGDHASYIVNHPQKLLSELIAFLNH